MTTQLKKITIILLLICLAIGVYLLLSQRNSLDKKTKIASVSIPTLINNCYRKNNKVDCFRQAAANLLDSYSLGDVVALFEENGIKNHIDNIDSCHDQLHFIGQEAYKRNPKIQELLSQCSTICLSGCYHGVLEAYLIENNLSLNNDAIANKEIPDICGEMAEYNKPIDFQECLHGLGHGFMFATENDLPRALHLCDMLNTKEEQERCHNGAFMENNNSAQGKSHPSKFVKKDDPIFPCSILDKKYLDNCYKYQTRILMTLGNGDWEKTFALCYTFPKDYWEQCFQSLGAVQPGITTNVELMNERCSLIPNTYYQDACVKGLVHNLNHQFNDEFASTISFCSIVKQAYKKSCYLQMHTAMKRWITEAQGIKAICSRIADKDYMNTCLGE